MAILNTTWLLTKLRGVYRVLADGIALPDVPTINVIASAVGTVGAAYDSVHNRIDITLPFGAVAADPDTYVVRDGDGNVAAVNVSASGTVETDGLTTTGAATVGTSLTVVGHLGANGKAAAAPTPITGSRSGATVAVVTALLADLDARGLITNSTTS